MTDTTQNVLPFATPTDVADPKSPPITGVQLEIPDSVDPLLVTILSWPRAHASASEAAFQEWLGKYLHTLDCDIQKVGSLNVYVATVPGPNNSVSTAMFSCHCDTIDPYNAAAETRKKLNYDPNFGIIGLEKGSFGSSLGADDGVGVWIMLRMIEAKIPGAYYFHRGEEVGCLSAKELANKHASALVKFDISVAFDRPRDNEVITHQRGNRCASDKFGIALASKLNEHGLDFAISDRGVFTDNAEYRKLINEVVNLGVGYIGQHGVNETLDYAHASALLSACTKINWEALPVDRDCTVADPVRSYSNYGSYAGFGGGTKPAQSFADYQKGWGKNKNKKNKKPGKWSAKDSVLDQRFPSFEDPLLDDDLDDYLAGRRASAKPTFDKSFAQELVDEARGMTMDDLQMLVEWSAENAVMIIAGLLRENARLSADLDTCNTLLGH